MQQGRPFSKNILRTAWREDHPIPQKQESRPVIPSGPTGSETILQPVNLFSPTPGPGPCSREMAGICKCQELGQEMAFSPACGIPVVPGFLPPSPSRKPKRSFSAEQCPLPPLLPLLCSALDPQCFTSCSLVCAGELSSHGLSDHWEANNSSPDF